MTHTEQVLNWLQHKPITPQDALAAFGCFRLAARIEELRRRGYNIVTTIVRQGKKKWAEYSMGAA